MDGAELIRKFPDIEPREAFSLFPRMPVPAELENAGYTWEDCHSGFLGAGGLMLVNEMARRLGLQEGMRLLDLACGNAAGSIFLAKQYGVTVIAADQADPSENWQRVKSAGLGERIVPVQMDARRIPFPEGYFDAVICLNSYFYFGEDEHYLPYLSRFLRPGGRIAIASPCYSQELCPETPCELLFDAPDFMESYAVHSPGWWQRHFESVPNIQVQMCAEHPCGRELWLDDTRWLIEHRHPKSMPEWMQQMTHRQMAMLLQDQERFVTYLLAVLHKEDPSGSQAWMEYPALDEWTCGIP